MGQKRDDTSRDASERNAHSEPKSHSPEPANLQQRSTSSLTFAQRLPLLEQRCAFFSSLVSFRLEAPLSLVFFGVLWSFELPSCLRFVAERLSPSSAEASSICGCKLSGTESRNLMWCCRLRKKLGYNGLYELSLNRGSTRGVQCGCAHGA